MREFHFFKSIDVMRHVRFFHVVLFAVVLFSIGAVDANAAFLYTLRFDRAAYSAQYPPGTVTVNLILREEVTSGSTSQLATSGLSLGNVRVDFGGGVATYVDNSAMKGPEFSAFSYDEQPTYVGINQAVLLGGGSGASGTQVAPGVREVNMGSLTFSVSPTPSGGTTSISFSDPSGSNDIVMANGNSLDSQIVYGSSLVTNPEPSTFLLTGMGIVGAAFYYRKRRRRSTPIQA